jgi:phage I-like protein
MNTPAPSHPRPAAPVFGASVIVCAADGQLPSRIELLPTGEFRLKDARGGGFRVLDAAALIRASLAGAPAGVLPIDFDHGLDGLGTRDGRAAGWITGLAVEGQRIVAQVEWTPAGEEALRGKTYRFISPVFTTRSKTDRTLTRILRAGLTNDPALPDLAQVASTQEDTSVNPALQSLAKALGLGEDADEEAVTAAALSAIETAGRTADIVAAAGLKGDLTETAATAIAARLKGGGTAPDPALYVPKTAFDDLAERCSRLEKGQAETRAEQAVTAARQGGKVAPAMEGWAKDYAAKDLAGFEAWAASAPKIVDGGELVSGLKPRDEGALSAEEKAVCAQMGLSEEAFLATKEGRKPAKKEA